VGKTSVRKSARKSAAGPIELRNHTSGDRETVTTGDHEMLPQPGKISRAKRNAKRNTSKRTHTGIHKNGISIDEQNITPVEQEHPTREKHFEILLKRLSACRHFDKLSALCVQAKEEIATHKIKGKPSEIYVMQGFDVDQDSYEIAPGDLPGPIRIPIKTVGDGNCLPRCGSLFAFGTERRHIEIWTRIVIELVVNEDLYLDDVYLNKGTDSQEPLSKLYATLSDLYIPGVHLTAENIRSIFRTEVLKCTKVNSYMGIWQLFALCNILQCPIISFLSRVCSICTV
jgi:hypothetical protein